MKVELLFVDVTPVGVPDRAERAILGMILFFWQIQAIVAFRDLLCDVRIPS